MLAFPPRGWLWWWQFTAAIVMLSCATTMSLAADEESIFDDEEDYPEYTTESPPPSASNFSLSGPDLCFQLLRNIPQGEYSPYRGVELDYSQQGGHRRGFDEVTRTLDSIVGMGWDDLLHVGTIPVLDTASFTHCRLSPDSAFLLPDGVVAVPVMSSTLDNRARYYLSHEDYAKEVTREFGIGGSVGGEAPTIGLSLSGNYATKNQDVKKKMHESESLLLRTTLTYHAYRLLADEGERQLSRGFRMRVEELARAENSSLTDKATLLAELLVRDFGTHVVTKADVGALIEQEDYIVKSNNTQNETALNELRVSAGVQFTYEIFKVGVSYSDNKTVNNKKHANYVSNRKDSVLRTAGGPNINEILNAWNGSKFHPVTMENLVPLDVKGVLLVDMLHPLYFPHYPPKLLRRVHSRLLSAINTYFANNAMYGCTDPEMKEFYRHEANVEDGSCQSGDSRFAFGGLYQTCECRFVDQIDEKCPKTLCERKGLRVNMFTDATYCEKGYKPVKILTLNRKQRYTLNEFECKNMGRVACGSEELDMRLKYDYIVKPMYSLNLSLFECRQANRSERPLRRAAFGGAYIDSAENSVENPVNGNLSCPGNFTPLDIGEKGVICYKFNYENKDDINGVHFGHFFSCQSEQAEQKCPKGHSRYLAPGFAEIGGGCQVYYCAKVPPREKKRNLPELKRPPYTNFSHLFDEDNESTTVLVVQGGTVKVAFDEATLIDAYLQGRLESSSQPPPPQPLGDEESELKSAMEGKKLKEMERKKPEVTEEMEMERIKPRMMKKLRFFFAATTRAINSYAMTRPDAWRSYIAELNAGTPEQREESMRSFWRNTLMQEVLNVEKLRLS